MPLLWFVYPLNGSGRRNPDAADCGQNSFLFFFFYVREMNPDLTTRQPPYRSARPTQFSLSGHRRDVGYWQFASIRTNPLNGRYRIVRHRRGIHW